MHTRASLTAFCVALGCLGILAPHAFSAAAGEMRALPDSVRLPDAGGLTIAGARIVRTALTPAEASATVGFSVSLRMRDFAGLQARVASGSQVRASEMESDYLPLRADYDRVGAWLDAQGFERTLADASHMNVFARGRVADISRVFGVQFARVAVSDGEYTSAVTAPSVPADLAGVILAVNELQPEFRMRHVSAQAVAPRDAVGGDVFVTPDNVASAYDIPASATGSGQIIAIVGEAPVLASDLTKFWSTVGVSQTAGNVATINVDGGPGSSPPAGLNQETSLDVEWAGAIAPGAGIRLYLAPNALECLSQIMNDLSSFPSMKVISISFGDTEGDQGNGTLQSFSQVFASFAASGVSVFAASGDNGSNPTPGAGGGNYSASEPLAVAYPASDPSVTGVGGTTVAYSGNWSYSGEVVWDDISSTQSASGGGVSSYFPKPSWQTGDSVLAAQTMRCVPDLAAISSADFSNVNVGTGFEPVNATGAGVLVYVNGTATALGGTSLACPVWAAIGALVNQARSAASQGPVGLLNSHIYGLSGSGAFNDITSGTNGAYSAGPGYDLCTGLGSPDVANLISALTVSASPPASHRLVDISTRAEVKTGANILIAGFSIDGAAGTNKSVLVRGIGPALAGFGIAGSLALPVVAVYDANGVLIASDTGWGNQPVAGTSPVVASFRQATGADMSSAGAFQLTAGSLDSAMVITLPAGNYTVEISGAENSMGVALAEVYELNGTAPELLGNVSSRCYVDTGAGVAICGFAIGGAQPMEVLVRGVGPALSDFGLSSTLLPTPSIEVYDQNSMPIASDTGWGNALVAGTSPVAATYRMATAADLKDSGAFAFAQGSADCAMVLTLPPGNYTVIVSGVGNTMGTALAEVYQMD
jgi:kumamolisin